MPTARIDDSLEMYYEDEAFTDPWKKPEAVVLHHGIAKNSRLWYAWVPLLARHYRVIRPDARGFGRSTVPPPGYAYSLSGFARDTARLLDQLGIEKAHWIGETVGGPIGLQFAVDYPERTRSVTVCTSPYNVIGVSWHYENIDILRRETMDAWVRKTMGPRLDPNAADAGYIQWYMSELASAPRHVCLEIIEYLDTQDLPALFPKVRAPVQLIIGEKSALREGFEPHRMQAAISGSRLAIIPGAGGFVQHSDPDKCAAIWRQFVGELH